MLLEKFIKISDFIRRIKLCFFLRSLFGFALGMKSKKRVLYISFFSVSLDLPSRLIRQFVFPQFSVPFSFVC